VEAFRRLASLPPYVFNTTGEMKAEARRRGEDIIDFGMGNPDGATPPHIVAKLIEAAARDSTHRYSLSKGIPRLRKAICDWYQRRCGVELDPNSEAIVTIGSKEGIAHLCLATLDEQDAILVPNPSYPIHIYGPTIAGAQVVSVEMNDPGGFLDRLQHELPSMRPRPKMLLLNFPANPTAQTVDRAFFERVIAFCRAEQIYLLHDFAYADLVFDGYRAPSVMEIPGAKDIAVEFFTLSKSYNMPGWRVGFMVGNRDLVGALTRIKSYFDYGTFTPIQIASIQALEGPQECVAQICETYRKRRDALVRGLNHIGWPVESPKATMFVWAQIPAPYRALGSLEFAKKLLRDAKTAVSPGIGFGQHGDGHVRFSLIENEERTRQAIRGIRRMFEQG
jgi:alanine-synthesizing transaminase